MAKRKVSALTIWMNAEFVGTWRIKSGVDLLQYADEWLENPRARPLSLSLPFTPGNQPIKGDKPQNIKQIQYKPLNEQQVEGIQPTPLHCCARRFSF